VEPLKRWQAAFLGAVLSLLVGGGLLLFLVPFGAALIAGFPPAFDRLTAYVLCPEAIRTSYRDYRFGQPTRTSPTAGTGHFTELTCIYEDGSQEVFPNEEVGLKGLAAAFTAAGLCGGAAVLAASALKALAAGRLARPRSGP
jgi:hypothetical protein